MLLLEINKLIPLCHQLQTITKTPLQNQVFLKVKGRVGYSGRHFRNFHTSWFIRLASCPFFFKVLIPTEGQFVSLFHPMTARITYYLQL